MGYTWPTIKLIEGENVWVSYFKREVFKRNNCINSIFTGKPGCQPKGSKVMLANGEWKNIENIKIGDKVLSPQQDESYKFSKVVRKVKWYCKTNYEIKQMNRNKKLLYRCSFNHEIPVYHRYYPRTNGKRKPGYFRIVFKHYSADEFSKLSVNGKSHNNIAFSAFAIPRFKDRKNCDVEPYTLGVYLGDGNFRDYAYVRINKNYFKMKRSDKKYFYRARKRSLSITVNNINYKIMEEVSKYYSIMNIFRKKGTNVFSYDFSINSDLAKDLNKYGLCNKKSGSKFIPKEALFSDLIYREKLLAGLIDTDGYYSCGGYSITTKSKRLAEDILFLVYTIGGRGNIRKVKKQIKKINFEGTYYEVSFYLHNLKLPLKLKIKIKDINSIYNGSNRIAIDCKKIPGDYVYGITIDSPSHWYITDNFMITKNSGKSWSMLSLAEQLNPDFELEGNWFFDAEKMFREMKNYYVSGKPKRGKHWWYDEAGIDLSNLNYYDEINRGFNAFFQTNRHRNYIFGCSVPFINFVSKGVRTLMNVHFKSDGWNKNNQTINVPRYMEYNGDMQKFYRKRLLVNVNNSYEYCNKVLIPKPSKRLIVEYEKIKKEFTGDLMESIANKISFFKKKQKDKINGVEQLTEPQERVLNILKKGFDIDEAAEELGIAVGSVYQAMKRIKKKGIIITPKKEKGGKVLKYSIIDNREQKIEV